MDLFTNSTKYDAEASLFHSLYIIKLLIAYYYLLLLETMHDLFDFVVVT